MNLRYLKVIFIGLILPSCALANTSLYQFRGCENEVDTLHLETCLKKCQAFGLSLSSFSLDLVQEQISETVWVANKKTVTTLFKNCAIKDLDNWRCRSESTLMGGKIFKHVYSQSGYITMNISGSGGQQYLCATRTQP